MSQNIETSVSASVLPVTSQGWFPLGLTGLILRSQGLSRVISSTTIRKYQFFGAQPSLWSNSHIHMWHWKKYKDSKILEKFEFWASTSLLHQGQKYDWETVETWVLGWGHWYWQTQPGNPIFSRTLEMAYSYLLEDDSLSFCLKVLQRPLICQTHASLRIEPHLAFLVQDP